MTTWVSAVFDSVTSTDIILKFGIENFICDSYKPCLIMTGYTSGAYRT